MNKSFVSVFLLCILFLSWIKPVLPFIEYELNKAYIQQNLCVKKEVRENTCKGKCHLKKRIGKLNMQEKAENTLPLPKSNLEDFQLYDFESSQFVFVELIKVIGLKSVPKDYHYQYNFFVFHPPEYSFKL